MAKKFRADHLIAAQGLTPDADAAARLVMAGQVMVTERPGQQPVTVEKPGQPFPATVQFSLHVPRYVSRGAYKLLTALERFSLDVNGTICLDAGASTGGFTDCLLQHGAAKVYAVDVGHAQLHEKLRNDPRVVSIEGINLRTAPVTLIPEPVNLIVADVSFISLTDILPSCLRWLTADGQAIVLIKPQFEVDARHTVKGVVRDPSLRQAAIDKIVIFCRDNLDLNCHGVLPAAIRGPKGNQEFLAWFGRKQQ